jgi:putative radical SAM enzyme (TIGR03279 family)
VTGKKNPGKESGGLVSAVRSGSTAATIGIRPGDRLLEVNGHPVMDAIDVQYHAAEEFLSLKWKRGRRVLSGEARRSHRASLGLEFAHPTFDTEIRRCNNRCPFCFVVQMAPGMRRTLHIKDDDYRYSFLYGHFVTLTNLAPDDWRRIAEQRLSPLYVSVHATEPEVRARVLGNPAAGDILDRLRFLAEHRIVVHAQVVLTQGLNDGAHLDRTLEDLSGLYPSVRSCSVVPVGVTRYQQNGIHPYDPEAMEPVIWRVEAAQREFLPRLGSRFAFLTDEWYLATGKPVPPLDAYGEIDLRENGLGLVRDFLEDWYVLRQELAGKKGRLRNRQATLVTGMLFRNTLEAAAAEFSALTGTGVRVIGVPNTCFGETVTVAGLLTAEDVIDAVRERGIAGPVFLPRVMFSRPPAVTLDDVLPREIAKALGGELFLVDSIREVVEVLRRRVGKTSSQMPRSAGRVRVRRERKVKTKNPH